MRRKEGGSILQSLQGQRLLLEDLESQLKHTRRLLQHGIAEFRHLRQHHALFFALRFPQKSLKSVCSKSGGLLFTTPAFTLIFLILRALHLMQAVDAEIEKAGGLTGGWSVVRHDVFMRVLRMFKMQASLAS
eukprot:1805542-Amphidinium_carterae.1